MTYRSLAGELLGADVVHEVDGLALIDVRVPGSRESLRRSRIPISEVDTGIKGTCFRHAD